MLSGGRTVCSALPALAGVVGEVEQLDVGREDVHALRPRAHPVNARVIHLGEDAFVAPDDDLLHPQLVGAQIGGAHAVGHHRHQQCTEDEVQPAPAGGAKDALTGSAQVDGDARVSHWGGGSLLSVARPVCGTFRRSWELLERPGCSQRLVELVLDFGVVQVRPQWPGARRGSGAWRATPGRRG